MCSQHISSARTRKHGDHPHIGVLHWRRVPRIFLRAPLSSDAVAFSLSRGALHLRDGKLPSNFPWSGATGDLPAFEAFDLDELVTKHPRFPLQIRQHPVTVLLFIRLLARIHIRGTIAQHAID